MAIGIDRSCANVSERAQIKGDRDQAYLIRWQKWGTSYKDCQLRVEGYTLGKNRRTLLRASSDFSDRCSCMNATKTVSAIPSPADHAVVYDIQ